MKEQEQEHDPDGVPTRNRQMDKQAVRQHDADPIEDAEEGWQVGKELAHVGESEDARKKAVRVHDEVEVTSPGVAVTRSGISETSATPLSLTEPDGTNRSITEHNSLPIEPARAPRGNSVPEYRAAPSRLPETISTQEILDNARTNPNGCEEGSKVRR